LSRRCDARGPTLHGMDVVAVLLAVAAFALLLVLIEALDRV
jgi:hypothetical protein